MPWMRKGPADRDQSPVYACRMAIFLRLVLGLLALTSEALASPSAAKPAPAILFVCEHGYGKSMVAAHFFKRMAEERGVAVAVDSRGVAPEMPVPPALVAGMARDGFDVAGFQPIKLTPADLDGADRVIVFNMDLPFATTTPVERWDSPALSEDYAKARDAIVAKLKTLLPK